ncbi:MAG: alpha/beta hydrolase [Longimicrobiaceae bacterium]
MSEHQLRVDRTARYALLGEPAGKIRELWIVCHGYRQLARYFIQRFEPLDDGTRLVAAPEALSRFYLGDPDGSHGPRARVGGTWMTSEDRENEITDYVNYLDLLHDRLLEPLQRKRPRVVGLGFSQGAATAARWAMLGESRPGELVLWGDSVPRDLARESLQARAADLIITLVSGRGDPAFPPERARKEARKLEEHGFRVRVVTFDGGHEIGEKALLRVASAPVVQSLQLP